MKISLEAISLPKRWQHSVRAAVVCAFSLAHAAVTQSQSWASNSPLERVRLRFKCERLRTRVAQLEEELELLRTRFSRVPPKNRPHFAPPERLRVLQLKAACSWSAAEAARRLLLAPSTITGWLRRLERDGEDALVRVPVPINRFPDYVSYLVREIGRVFPALGRRKIAEFLARGSLHLSASTVRRALAKPLDGSDGSPAGNGGRSFEAGEQAPSTEPAGASNRTVSARYPGHVWNIDITVVPTAQGFWCSALPFSWPTVWPFCWHVAGIVDHFSRKVIGFEVYAKQPTAQDICRLLDTTGASVGQAPKYIVSDQGVQFRSDYLACCERHGIKPRFGTVGRSGSIALIERFWATLKGEGLRRILVPFSIEQMREELRVFCLWYNSVRPHSSLGGATPDEIYFGTLPARDGPRFEPRKRFPLKTRPSKQAPRAVRAKRGVKLEVVVGHFEDRRHLPVIKVKRAA